MELPWIVLTCALALGILSLLLYLLSLRRSIREVAEELEEEAWGYLPFINITEITDGVITGVEQGTIPEPEPEPEPEPTLEDRISSLEGAIERGLSL